MTIISANIAVEAFTPLSQMHSHLQKSTTYHYRRRQDQDTWKATPTTTSRFLQRQQHSYKRCSLTPSNALSTTCLHLMTAPSGIAAVAGAVSGGLFAGSFHAIAGPDHLAALLPRCVGQRWYRASRIGALWGMGHGVSVILLGITAFFVKGKISTQMNMMQGSYYSNVLSQVSSVTEIAVGVSLIVIGLMGIKEARDWKVEDDDDDDDDSNDKDENANIQENATVVPSKSLSAAAVVPSSVSDSSNQQLSSSPKRRLSAQKRAVVFNGLLHGFSWDGAPSLAPALAVATWRGNLAFLLAYAIGTIGVMTVATTVIGEGTRRAGKAFHRPDLPQKLSFVSSILALAIGIVWCVLAVV